MDMLSKLPEMEDTALVNLQVNASRLEEHGTKAQQAAAAELLPALADEIAKRKEAALAAAAAKRKSKRASKAAA